MILYKRCNKDCFKKNWKKKVFEDLLKQEDFALLSKDQQGKLIDLWKREVHSTVVIGGCCSVSRQGELSGFVAHIVKPPTEFWGTCFLKRTTSRLSEMFKDQYECSDFGPDIFHALSEAQAPARSRLTSFYHHNLPLRKVEYSTLSAPKQ